MLEQRQQRHRRKLAERRFRRKPRENPRRRFRKRLTAGILSRDFPARERRLDAPGERAIRRDQRGGLALMHRFAQRHRDRERLLLGIGRLDHADVFQRAVRARAERGIGGVLLPQLGRGGGAQRLRDRSCSRPVVRRQLHDGVAANTDAGEQRLQRELRMPWSRRNPLALVAGNEPPGRLRRDRYRGPATPPRRAAIAQ